MLMMLATERTLLGLVANTGAAEAYDPRCSVGHTLKQLAPWAVEAQDARCRVGPTLKDLQHWGG